MGLKDTYALIILGIFVIIYSTLLYYTLKELPINENEDINKIWVLLRKLLQRTFFGTFDFVSDLVVIVNVIFYNPILFYFSLGSKKKEIPWYCSYLKTKINENQETKRLTIDAISSSLNNVDCNSLKNDYCETLNRYNYSKYLVIFNVNNISILNVKLYKIYKYKH